MAVVDIALPVVPPLPAVAALDPDERLARLGLARSRNVGPRTFTHLIRRFGSAVTALEALPTLAARGGNASYRPFPIADAEAELAAGAAAGAELRVLGEAGYPPLLARIDTPPAVVWMTGDLGVFDRPAVAVVGARNASAVGLRTAANLVRDLGAAGFVIVSGLARGVDAAAHEAALGTGTVAVMAGGIDRVFPPENRPLADRIAANGALISECPMGVEPTGRHFPKRNRLIAGLAQGVVLIEAASRSGSLITARYALDQGREVMACPAAAEDPRSGGCNAMIRDGAALIRDAKDVIEALAAPAMGPPGLAEDGGEFVFDVTRFGDEAVSDDYDAMADFDLEASSDPGALSDQIIDLLGPTPVDLDELARASGASPAELSLAILELDLAGRIDVLSGGRVALAGPLID